MQGKLFGDKSTLVVRLKEYCTKLRGTFGFDCVLDLDLKSFLRTGFLTGSERKIWIGLESKILDWILDFFQPLYIGLLNCMMITTGLHYKAGPRLREIYAWPCLGSV